MQLQIKMAIGTCKFGATGLFKYVKFVYKKTESNLIIIAMIFFSLNVHVTTREDSLNQCDCLDSSQSAFGLT